MMKLKLVNYKSVYEAASATNGNAPTEDENHGTILLKELVEPWAGIEERVVALYSYFAEIQ